MKHLYLQSLGLMIKSRRDTSSAFATISWILFSISSASLGSLSIFTDDDGMRLFDCPPRFGRQRERFTVPSVPEFTW